jgi:hypothetical protein
MPSRRIRVDWQKAIDKIQAILVVSIIGFRRDAIDIKNHLPASEHSRFTRAHCRVGKL